MPRRPTKPPEHTGPVDQDRPVSPPPPSYFSPTRIPSEVANRLAEMPKDAQSPMKVKHLMTYLGCLDPEMLVTVSYYTCGQSHELPLTLQRLELRRESAQHPSYLNVEVEEN